MRLKNELKALKQTAQVLGAILSILITVCGGTYLTLLATEKIATAYGSNVVAIVYLLLGILSVSLVILASIRCEIKKHLQ